MKSTTAGAIAIFLGAGLFYGVTSNSWVTSAAPNKWTPQAAPQTDRASTALSQGRKLLKRGQTAEALVQLQTALNLYVAAKNNRGIGSAHNELGDLYLDRASTRSRSNIINRPIGLVGAAVQEQRQGAAAGSASRMVGSDASAATSAAASLSDTSFNANLILAKIDGIQIFAWASCPKRVRLTGRCK